jgi:hypothetical protein
MMAFSPMVTPGMTDTVAPSHARFSITVGPQYVERGQVLRLLEIRERDAGLIG